MRWKTQDKREDKPWEDNATGMEGRCKGMGKNSSRESVSLYWLLYKVREKDLNFGSLFYFADIGPIFSTACLFRMTLITLPRQQDYLEDI